MPGRTCSQLKDGLVHGRVILIGLVLLISACKPAPATFRPPDLNEIKTFVKNKGITPVADKLLDDSSVLLYEDSASFGCYTLTVREPGGTLETNHTSALKSDQPILILGGLEGDKPFLAVVIQDAALLAETKAIEVFIDSQNRLTATTNGLAGVIIVSPDPVKEWGAITLYDAQGKVLYRQEEHPPL